MGLVAPAADLLAVQAVVNRSEGSEYVAIAGSRSLCAKHELKGNVLLLRASSHRWAREASRSSTIRRASA
jgi:hypothetical protein